MQILLMVLLAAAGQTPLYEMTKTNVDDYLSNIQVQQSSFASRLHIIAESSLGTPYVGDPLGEGPRGTYDKDP
ncbi:MAG: hypothetical protein KAH38_03985, partial [Candidatus Hydrogenedentes bacterium]|nr:hypothetical protein [Candidatus Hydrogenedentota bacterium]